MNTIASTRLSGLLISVIVSITSICYFMLNGALNLSQTELSNTSALFIILTCLIIPVCIVASYNNIVHSYGAYIMLLLALEGILVYLFCTGNLISFYVAFEMALLPLYVLVGCYGASTNRIRASLLLWSYTMVGSLCLLVGIVYLILSGGTTDFAQLSIYSLDAFDTRII